MFTCSKPWQNSQASKRIWYYNRLVFVHQYWKDPRSVLYACSNGIVHRWHKLHGNPVRAIFCHSREEVKKTTQPFGLFCDKPMTPGQCNMVVQRLGDYLIESGLWNSSCCYVHVTNIVFILRGKLFILWNGIDHFNIPTVSYFLSYDGSRDCMILKQSGIVSFVSSRKL